MSKVYYNAATDKLKRGTTAFGHTQSYKIGYLVVSYYIINYLVPFTLLIFMTTRLIQALRASKRRHEQMTSKKKDENDITLTLISVCIIFMICQLGIPVRRLIVAIIDENEQGCGYFYFYYRPVASNLPSLNSAVNYLLYWLFSSRFRQDVRRKILGIAIEVGPETMTQNTENVGEPSVSVVRTNATATNQLPPVE